MTHLRWWINLVIPQTIGHAIRDVMRIVAIERLKIGGMVVLRGVSLCI